MLQKQNLPLFTAGAITLFLVSCTNSVASLDGDGGAPKPQNRFEAHSQICQSYGFASGTVEMAQCIQQEVIAVRNNRNQRNRAIVGGLVAALAAGLSQ